MDLIAQIAVDNVVPFIGAGFSKAVRVRNPAPGALAGMPTYAELLQALLERARLSTDDQEIVRNYLGRKSSGSASDYDKAAEVLREGMGGDVPFYMSMRDILEPIDRELEASLAHRLLGGLSFRRLITINYDRLLEGYTAPRHEMITPNDERAFLLFTAERKRPVIFKLHGDISRPDTIPWGKAALLEYYGYDRYEHPLANMPPRTRHLRQFLEEVFRDNTVLFLGTSLATSEGFAQVLLKLVEDWGGSLPHRHYALVAYDPKLAALRDQVSQRMNLTYLYYEPDAHHSQVWEFIASLKAGRQPPPIRPGALWETWYLQKERPEYLRKQLERERTATAVRYLTPNLTNAIATEEFLSVDCAADLAGRYPPKQIRLILAVMLERADNLDRRLRGEPLEARVLFLESELRRSLDPALPGARPQKLARAAARYRHLLDLQRDTRLEFRIIPDLTADQLKQREASFALIFNQQDSAASGEPLADVTIAYSSQATNDFPEIHMVHINTEEIWRHSFLFERFWAAALSQAESVQRVRTLIDQLPQLALPEPPGSGDSDPPLVP